MHFSQASDGPSAASLTIVFSLLICERDMCTWAWVPAEVGVPDSPAAAVTGSFELPDMVVRSGDALEHWAVSPALSQLLSD